MIDFRYHLVSIVSIFLALAVGIVLGAGPLKEDLGNTLTRRGHPAAQGQDRPAGRARPQPQQGTAPRHLRRGGRTHARGRPADRQDRRASSSCPAPTATSSRPPSATLTAAGAKVGSTVTVSDAWVDPDKRTFRTNLAGQLGHAGRGARRRQQPPTSAARRGARRGPILAGSDRARRTALGPEAAQALDGAARPPAWSTSAPDHDHPGHWRRAGRRPGQGRDGRGHREPLAATSSWPAPWTGGSGAVVVTRPSSRDTATSGSWSPRCARTATPVKTRLHRRQRRRRRWARPPSCWPGRAVRRRAPGSTASPGTPRRSCPSPPSE